MCKEVSSHLSYAALNVFKTQYYSSDYTELIDRISVELTDLKMLKFSVSVISFRKLLVLMVRLLYDL